MAVASTVTNVSYPGNNSTSTEYPVTFPVLDGSHIKVGQRDAGGPFLQLASWAFTVVPKPGGSFAITTTAAVPPTSTLVIWREVPVTQPTELPLAGPLPSTSLETGLDRGVMQTQELREEIGRAVRLDRAAGHQAPLTPVPNALLGFDGAGDWAVTDAARIRELAQLEGDGSNLQATWADAAAQFSVVPAFTGQMGIRRSDNTLWTARSTTGGDWVPARIPRVIVSTEDELLDAIAANRSIFVSGTINISSSLDLETDGIDIQGDGKNSTLVMPHNGATPVAVVRVMAKNIRLAGLKITSNHPLTSAPTVYDRGVEISTDASIDISGLRVENCEIYNVGVGIFRDSVFTAKKSSNVQVVGNHIHSFTLHGVWIDANVSHLVIERNLVDGKPTGTTHGSTGNGIRTGNNADFAQVNFNTIRNYGRHAIEHWNSQDSALTVGGNKDGKFFGNCISGPLFTPYDSGIIGLVSFGISVFGHGTTQVVGNSVRNGHIGIEVYSDNVNTGGCIVMGNYVKDVLTQGLSLNTLSSGIVEGNTIDRVVPPSGNECFGIQLVYGCEKVAIRGNLFINAGSAPIRLNGLRLTITGVTQAADGVFTCSTALSGRFAVGKKICIREVGGMTGVNDRYYTITWVSGNQFRCGVNTSAMPAYTSGGCVQEAWAGLVIEGNTFWITEDLHGSNFQTAVYIYDFQQAVVRNNSAFYTAAANFFTYRMANLGTVYNDNSQTTVSISGGPGNQNSIGGSNQYILIFPTS
jgi:hypothetical protein